MAIKSVIAIIGATGNMGAAIARSLSESSFRLLLIGRNKLKLDALSEELKSNNATVDVEVISCAREGCWEADIIIPAVPYSAEREVAQKIKQVATGKVVISISNPGNDLQTGTTISAAEELQQLLPYSKVVKAFNTISAQSFNQPVNNNIIDCFIAGDDEEAMLTVAEVVKATGCNPIITGVLKHSVVLESNTQLKNFFNN